MVELGFRKPNNKVREGGALGPEFFTVGANATAAKMLPGIVVCKDTVDSSVKESDASGNDIGFLLYEDTPAVYRPASITTAYARGDRVAVGRGGGARQMGILASGQNVVNGQPLTVTTDGQLTAATAGTHDVVADADESVNATSASAVIWVITRK